MFRESMASLEREEMTERTAPLDQMEIQVNLVLQDCLEILVLMV